MADEAKKKRKTTRRKPGKADRHRTWRNAIHQMRSYMTIKKYDVKAWMQKLKKQVPFRAAPPGLAL